jgi:hypothetical protein
MKKNKLFITILVILFTYTNLSYSQDKNTETKTKNPTQNSKQDIKKLNDTKNKNEEPTIDLNNDAETNLENYSNSATVQALNKTTAKTTNLELKIGQKISFGSLKIIAHKCWKSPLDQRPENKILLEIFDVKNDKENKNIEKRIFYGWMFSSSPSISGMEHPIYDIIALNCKFK